jgi:hypothetical protein
MMRKRIILDTNLLILLVAGVFDIEKVRNHKRLQNFQLPDDYDTLLLHLEGAREIIVTPNTLSEASNLLRLIGGEPRKELTKLLGFFIQGHPEIYVPSVEASQEPEFVSLGLTDAVLLHLAEQRIDGERRRLITTDFDLVMAALERDLDVINFNEWLSVA